MVNHIYIHIPFCQRKCLYCSFHSVVYDKVLVEKYLACLNIEIDFYLLRYDVVPETIYFGGGTPSLMSPNELERILKKFALSKVKEITLEVNPATVTISALKRFRELGINRLSLGVQSMNDKELEFLGRTHRVRDVLDLYDAGLGDVFDNVSFDLIYGMPTNCRLQITNHKSQITNLKSKIFYPHQKHKNASCRLIREDCFGGNSSKDPRNDGGRRLAMTEKVEIIDFSFLQLNPSHISTYCLSLEENVPLYKEKDKLPDDDRVADMYFLLQEILEANSFEQYELSSFCRDGKISLHNMCYWSSKWYLGFGAGASGYVDNKRYQNVEMEKYIKSSEFGVRSSELKKERILTQRRQRSHKAHRDVVAYCISQSEIHSMRKRLGTTECGELSPFTETEIDLSESDIEKEYIITGLRKVEGISIDEFDKRFNCSFLEKYEIIIKKMLEKGLIEVYYKSSESGEYSYCSPHVVPELASVLSGVNKESKREDFCKGTDKSVPYKSGTDKCVPYIRIKKESYFIINEVLCEFL